MRVCEICKKLMLDDEETALSPSKEGVCCMACAEGAPQEWLR